MTTVYRGVRIVAKRVRTRYGDRAVQVKIDGHLHWVFERMGVTPEQATTETTPYIDDSIARPDAWPWTRYLSPDQLAKKVRS